MGWQRFEVEEALRQRMTVRYQAIDGRTLAKLTVAALGWLRANCQHINTLNVFPVPDGDTGTNMVLTLQSACDEIATSQEASIGKVAHAIANGALMGARGNSGVILSQLWRGFARSLDEKPTMDATAFVAALAEARNTAYKGVVRPVEGTILTVAKDIASAAEEALAQGASSVLEILDRVVGEADLSVERTPELLSVLKEAGVVDAGGKGLFIILEGMLRLVYRQPLDKPLTTVQPLSALVLERTAEIIEPGQDWEVVVDFQPRDPFDPSQLLQALDKMGTSIQIGEGDGMYRMHIHVPDKTQYRPIECIAGLGTVTKVAIENLQSQMEGKAEASNDYRQSLCQIKPGEIAAIAVSPGPGIARVFCSLGAAGIVEGGQTMNPSTKEILAAFEDLPTDKVVILPNNKNVRLAAQQAAQLSIKNVAVIPSVSVPQGIAAMLSFDRSGDFPLMVDAMTSGLTQVQSGSITSATRSAEIDGVQVAKGQFIGLLNERLTAAGGDVTQVLLQILEQAGAESAELVTFYYGADLTAEQAGQVADQVRTRWPNLQAELIDGGQPHYHLIFSLE